MSDAPRELALEEDDHGFFVHLQGALDPRRQVPWLGLAVLAAAAALGLAVTWWVALPLAGVGFGLLQPTTSRPVHGVGARRGKLTLYGALELPLHRVHAVERRPGGLHLALDEGGHTLALAASPEALDWLAARIRQAREALGDAEEVPDPLARLREDPDRQRRGC